MNIQYDEENEEFVDESFSGLELDKLYRVLIQSLRKHEYELWQEIVFEKANQHDLDNVPDSVLMRKRLGNFIFDAMNELARIGEKVFNKS